MLTQLETLARMKAARDAEIEAARCAAGATYEFEDYDSYVFEDYDSPEKEVRRQVEMLFAYRIAGDRPDGANAAVHAFAAIKGQEMRVVIGDPANRYRSDHLT